MNSTQATQERITVILIPQAGQQLRQLQERTNLSKTDLTNRAITLYEFVDAQLRAGQDMAARDKETGKIKLVQLLEASVGQATPADPAWTRRGSAGQRRQGRHRRQLRNQRPSWFPAPEGLAGRKVSTA